MGSAVGPYQILAKLGAGGMGEVFLGHDPRLQRRVALKCLTAAEAQTGELHTRILREARAVARLNHPHIAAVYDVIEQDGRTFIVMEFVEGESLSARMTRERMPLDQVRAIGRQLASALVAAHAQGVIHRDLKPQNIHLTSDGSIKVLDFGVAKLAPPIPVGADAPTGLIPTELTLAGSPGTPVYMSPEQLFSREVDARSDIYSAGVILYEMATGRRPYEETGAVALALAVTQGPAPPPETLNPEIWPDLSDAISRALEREPASRFQSARDLETALAPTTDVAPVRVGTTISRYGRRLRVITWEWAWKPAAVAAVLLLVGVVARKPLMVNWGPRASSAAAGPIVLAILPVENVTTDVRGVYLGTGVAIGIADNFGSLPGFTVLPRSATAAYEKKRTDAGIERDLGAHYVLDLTLRALSPPTLVVRLRRPGNATPDWDETIHGDPLTIEKTILNGLGRAIEKGGLLPRPFTRQEWERIQRLPTTSGQALADFSESYAVLDRDALAPGKVDRAIELLQNAVRIDPQFSSAWARLGDVRFDKYQNDKDPALATQAIDAVNRAIAIDPGHPRVYYSLANMQYRTGHLNEAVISFRRALQLRPDFDDAHRLLGSVLASLGQVDEAEAELREAIRIRPDWNNFFALGTIEYRSGRYAQAVQAFRKATELSPDNAGAFQMLGTSYYVLGDIRQAVGNFEHAVRLGPSAPAYANLGMAYYESGQYEEAMRSYEESLKRDPNSALNHRNIADVYQRLGRIPEARTEYDRAIAVATRQLQVNPRDVRAISLIALCEARLGRGSAAERHAAEAVALEPTNRVALQRSAEVHALLNQPEAALRDLEAAIAHGFEPRMARIDDELASLRKHPRFEEILRASPGNTSAKPGARP